MQMKVASQVTFEGVQFSQRGRKKMGKNIKRLSLALVALGLTAPVFASTCNPFTVTVPNQQGGFTVGVDALYLRPSAPNTSYGATLGTFSVGPTPAALITVNAPVTINSVDPTYHWGFDVTAAYRFPCTGNDVSLSWTHLGQGQFTDSDSKPIFTTSPLPGAATLTANASSSQTFKLDAVDLDVGQKLNIGDYFLLRMFAGLRYAYLEQRNSTTYTATLKSAPTVEFRIL